MKLQNVHRHSLPACTFFDAATATTSRKSPEPIVRNGGITLINGMGLYLLIGVIIVTPFIAGDGAHLLPCARTICRSPSRMFENAFLSCLRISNPAVSSKQEMLLAVCYDWHPAAVDMTGPIWSIGLVYLPTSSCVLFLLMVLMYVNIPVLWILWGLSHLSQPIFRGFSINTVVSVANIPWFFLEILNARHVEILHHRLRLALSLTR